MRTEFTKYEGAGNDFILIDNRDGVFTVSYTHLTLPTNSLV